MLTLSTPYLVATLFLAVIPVADQSFAQVMPPCDDRQKVLDFLLKEYGEQVVGYGIVETGGLLQILRNGPDSEKETWSIIYSRNASQACLLASGTGWRVVFPEPTGPKT